MFSRIIWWTFNTSLYAQTILEGQRQIFCDADDYYEPNSLKKVSKIFEQYEIDIVYMALYIVNNGAHTLRSVKKERIINSFEAIDNVISNPCVMGSVWNKFFKKELIGGHELVFEKAVHIKLGLDVLDKCRQV